MGRRTVLAKLADDAKNCKWIYRFPANPGMPRGGIVPPTPVLAPGSALGSRPRVALSSVQVPPVYSGPRPSGNSRPRRRSRGHRGPRGPAPRLGLGQLPLSLGPDLLLPTRQLIGGRDVTDRAVQADRVIVLRELGEQSSGVFQAQRRLDSDALPFRGLEPPLHLAVTLRVVRRRPHMGHPADPDELLELPGDELRAVIRDDPRPRPGEALAGPLHDRLDVPLGHALADLPVDEEPAVAVEEATEVEERPADVEVRDIDVPVLMRPRGLLETPPLLRGLPPAGRELAGGLEDAIDAGGADGHDVGVQHHVRQPSVSLPGVAVMEGHDG